MDPTLPDRIKKPTYPQVIPPSYNLAEEFSKFTKKQQIMLESWLCDPMLKTAKQVAIKLKQDHTTVCTFLYHDDKCRTFLANWAIQTLPDQIHAVDMQLYKEALTPGLAAKELFYKRFGLLQKDNILVQNNTQVNVPMQININPVKSNE